jgi:hypothetical protein
MRIKLNEKEYRVLKRVLREAKSISVDDVSQQRKSNLLKFYDYVRDWAKELKLQIVSPVPSVGEVDEAYASGSDTTLRFAGTNSETGAEVEIKTDFFVDGTYNIRISFESDEHAMNRSFRFFRSRDVQEELRREMYRFLRLYSRIMW